MSAIKYSSMKSGVFPVTLHPILEGVPLNYLTLTQIVAQCMRRHPWTTAVTPWRRSLSAPVADWRAYTQKILVKSNIGDNISKNTYMDWNLSVEIFLAKMRWFPDRLIVVFKEVVIDLYWLVTVGCLCKNALTSLYVTVPSDETKYKIQIKLIF